MRTNIAVISAALLVLSAACEAPPAEEPEEPTEETEADGEAGDAPDEDEEHLEEIAEELGYPPAPEGEQRQAFLDAVAAVDAGFVFPDEDTVIDRARDLCVEANDDGDEAAAERVTTIWLHQDYPDRETTPEEAEQLLAAVQDHVC